MKHKIEISTSVDEETTVARLAAEMEEKLAALEVGIIDIWKVLNEVLTREGTSDSAY